MNYNILALQFLGIILVVAGHKQGGVVLFDNFFPLYSFHMPLFIFISGYFFKPDIRIKEFFLKKLKKTLIPLFICNILYLIISQVLRNKGIIYYGYDIGLKSLFITPLTYGHQSGLNVAAWFVPALFFTAFFYIIFRKLILLVFKNEYLITMIFLIISLIGIYFAINGYNTIIYINITRTAMLLFFYQLGYLYKSKLEKRDTLNSCLYFIILFCFQLLLIFFFEDFVYVLPYMIFANKNIIFPILTSITGILFWLRIAKILSEVVKNSKIATYIGKNTWTIMMHHQFVFFIINFALLIINQRIFVLEGFNADSFRNNLWYQFVPNEKYQFLIIYIILGIAIPLLIKWFYENKIKQRIVLKLSKRR